MFHKVMEGPVSPDLEPFLRDFPNPVNECEIPKNFSQIPVLIKCRVDHGFPTLQQIAGSPLVCMFPATTKDPIETASIVPFKKIIEILPGSIIFG
jgi:hypothetical protein